MPGSRRLLRIGNKVKQSMLSMLTEKSPKLLHCQLRVTSGMLKRSVSCTLEYGGGTKSIFPGIVTQSGLIIVY